MLKLATMLAAAALFAAPAFAGQTCYQVGSQFVCNGTGDDAGYNSNSYRLGNNLVIQQNDTNSDQSSTTTCYWVGNNIVCN